MKKFRLTSPLSRLPALGHSLVAGVALALSAGCTTSVGDIDRTQPDLYQKADFNGQWFIRQSVIDVPSTSTASFIGEMGGLESLVWDIQQDYLVGYRSYEQLPGSDETADTNDAQPSEQPVADGLGEGRDPTIYKGNPIVAYPIDGHVDVQREYNSRTGEQTNVIVENSSDRPWYERKYMRINWATNEVDSFLMFGDGDFSTFIPENEGGTYALHLERNDEGELTYLDFTERSVVSPSLRSCLFYLFVNEIGDCTGEELKVRTSLLKVDPEREQAYEPLFYDDQRHGEFGYFRTERPTYDRARGNTYTGINYLANRHDIWESSYDSSGNAMPFARRTLRPVVYTLSPNYPEDLIEVSEQMAAEYDLVLKEVAWTARGQTQDELEEDLMRDTGNDCLFCLDLNEDGLARIGDLRRNFIYWVDDLQRIGPLGYGPSSAHPETGRIVSGAAYVYGASVDRSVEVALDTIRLLNDDLSEEDLIDGNYIRNAVRGALKPIDPRAANSLLGVTLEELPAKLLGSRGAARLEALRATGLPSARLGFEQAQLKRIQGTPLESYLLPAEEQPLFDPQGILALKAGPDAESDSQLGALSVVNWATKDALQDLSELEQLASERSLWLREFSDPAIIGLARELANKDWSESRMRQYLREEIFRGVMLHEMGHTVGLRHNFGGSADPLNYGDQYWQMRSMTPLPAPTGGNLTRPMDEWLFSNCSIVDASNEAACETQHNDKMAEFQYTSIMDYGGRFNSDFHGLGMYDKAAMAAAYGDLVEVWDDDVQSSIPAGVQDGIRFANTLRSPILGQGLAYQFAEHYTTLPALLGGVDNVNKRHWMPRSEFIADDPDGPLQVPYMACYDEYVDSVETCHRWDVGADGYEITADLIQRYKEYYVFNNFQRDRVGFSGVAVLQRTASRYFLPMNNMYQHWLFQNFFGRGSTVDGRLTQVSAQEGFNTLWNVIGTPSFGSYSVDPTTGNYVLRSLDENAPNTTLTIPRGEGRREFSSFDVGSGYNLFQRVLESGHFYDRLAALIAMTSSDARAIGVGQDVAADALRYSIPYYIVFNQEIDGLFGGVFNRDYATYAPKVIDGATSYRSVFQSAAQQEQADTAPVIQADMSWTSRIWTLLYGMANLQSNFSTEFVQRGQISLLGSGEVITPGEGYEPVQVEDPFSGRVYAAYRETAAVDPGAWYGAVMLEQVQGMIDQYNEMVDMAGADSIPALQLRNAIEFEFNNVEIVRSLYLVFNKTFG